MAPTLAAANALYGRRVAEATKGDANNQLWAIEAIQDYNPEHDLDKITAKVMLINDAEDHANPPELGTVERAMKRVRHGRYVLIRAGPQTHGHFTHFYAAVWKPYLIEFMKTSTACCWRRRPNRLAAAEPVTDRGHVRRTGGAGDRRQQSPGCGDRAPVRGGGGASRRHLRSR